MGRFQGKHERRGFGVGSAFWFHRVSPASIVLPGPQGNPVRGGAASALIILLNCSAQSSDLPAVTRGREARAGRQRLSWLRKTGLVAPWLRAALGHGGLWASSQSTLSARLTVGISTQGAAIPSSERYGAPSLGYGGLPLPEGSPWNPGWGRSQTPPCRPPRPEGQR